MSPRNYSKRFTLLFLLFTLAAGSLAIVRLPGTMHFDNFAFFDTGANLTANYLLENGYRPGVDFGYPYGLLGLLAGTLCFRLMTRSPWSYQVAMWLFNLAQAAALSVLIIALDAGLVGILVFLLTLPIVLYSSYLTFSHAIEATLFLYALAVHALGYRSIALALVSLAILAKPSLGYVYGFFLLIFIGVDLYRNNRFRLREFFSQIKPAAVTGLAGCILLIATFRFDSFAKTISPMAGAGMYSKMGFGILRGGKSFWLPAQPSGAYYLESTAGFYILAVVGLLFTALVLAAREVFVTKERRCSAINTEIVFTCAGLQVAFVTLMWGNPFSWTYYSYLPVIGLVAAGRFGWRWSWFPLVISLMVPAAKLSRIVVTHIETRKSVPATQLAEDSTNRALLQVSQSSLTYQLWFLASRSPQMANLWASAAEQAEWQHVEKTIRGFRTAALGAFGSVSVLYPDLFMPPVSLYLLPGLALPQDVERQADQLRQAEMIVTLSSPKDAESLPSLSQVVARRFIKTFAGTYFDIYGLKESQGEGEAGGVSHDVDVEGSGDKSRTSN